MSGKRTSYGRPSSSSAIEALMPLGVCAVYSTMFDDGAVDADAILENCLLNWTIRLISSFTFRQFSVQSAAASFQGVPPREKTKKKTSHPVGLIRNPPSSRQ